MKKITPLQEATMAFLKDQIEDAKRCVKKSPTDKNQSLRVEEALHGIVYSQGGNCTIRTLKALEKKGLIIILEDNSGIGTSLGAFPSKVKVIGYDE